MKIGDKVCVCNKSWAYSGAFRGKYGDVKTIYNGKGHSVGVKLDNLVNENSSKGLYYFDEDELELVLKAEDCSFFSDSSFLNGLRNTKPRYANPFTIKDVIFNNPAVIVLWADGTKTVVKCSENDIYDPEKGLAMAISKKALGNQGNYYNIFKKYLPEDVDDFGLHPDLDSLSGYSWMNKAIENAKDKARHFALDLGK